jgi:ABC-type transport system substrate-binding protein
MMEFAANPDYFRGKPQIARVILKFGSPVTAVPELLSRNVDAVCYPPRKDLFNVSRNQSFRVHQHFVSVGRGIFWNLRHRFFQDRATRQALTHAINRIELLQVLNLPNDTNPIDYLPTEQQARNGNFPAANPHSPETAHRLLDTAGWKLSPGMRLRKRAGEPFCFKALVLSTLQGALDSAVYVQDQLKRMGIRMNIVTHSDDSLVSSRIRSGEFEAVIAGLGTFGLESFLRSTGYDNPVFFALLDRVRTVFDPEERKQIQSELTQIFRTDVPVTFLFPFAVTTITDARIRGLDDSPYRGDLTQCMDELWLEEVA